MRRVSRPTLDAHLQKNLRRRQKKADDKNAAGMLDVNREWKGARKTKTILGVLALLRVMMGERQRCMYCLDSHGTDIEHFWPKATYPQKMFQWPNMLLCCTECGRFKGPHFPLDGSQPLMIDPSSEEPWLHLDYDPDTGNIVARFDASTGAPSEKGLATVKLLQLDRREALAAGHQRTYRRLSTIVDEAARQQAPDGQALHSSLQEADEHGLLGWCFHGTGQYQPPFRTLRENHGAVWAACIAELCPE